jgi:mono/diheme cytochrome c family protein
MKLWMGLGAVAAIGLAACIKTEMPQPDEGQALYAENCAMCHGPTGRGDGMLADSLKDKPVDLTQISRRNDGAFPRAVVMSQIDGYTRGQLGDNNMPEFGLLLKGPTVPVDAGDGVMTPTPRPLAALMAYLEDIQE